MKKLKYFLIVLLFFFVIVIHFVAPYFIIRPYNFLVGGESFDEKNKIELPKEAQRLTIVNSGVKFQAVLFKTEEDTVKGTIILLHGIRCSKFTLLSLKDVLLSKGYNAVLMDIRGHDSVKDQYLTYGYYEKKDISALIDTLYANGLSDNIGIWGQSLGASIGIQAVAYDKRIQFGIIESAFSDFPKIVHAYVKRLVGFDIPFITNYLIYRAGNIAQFEPQDVKPFILAKNITQPVFIAHGKKDKVIFCSNAITNYDSIRCTNKRIYLLDNADHADVWKVGGSEYFDEVFKFIQSATKDL